MVNRLDLSVNLGIESIRNPTLDNLFIFLDKLTSPIGVIILTIIILTTLFYFKQKRNALIIIAVIFSSWLVENVLKIIFARSRPASGLIIENSYSFPSGHALVSSATILVIIGLYYKKLKFEKTINLAGAILIGLIVFSRLYLGVHWLSDVLAGIAIGAIIAKISLKLSKTKEMKNISQN